MVCEAVFIYTLKIVSGHSIFYNSWMIPYAKAKVDPLIWHFGAEASLIKKESHTKMCRSVHHHHRASVMNLFVD